MITITPFMDITPDILQELLSKKTLRLELGKSYFNEIGEIRRIVSFTDDLEYGDYQYIDHLDYSYTMHGVYDLHDTVIGITDLDLVEEV
jgi:hypothetical protein